MGPFIKIIGTMMLTTDGHVQMLHPVIFSRLFMLGFTPTNSSRMTSANSQIVEYQVVNQAIATDFGVPNHLPTSFWSRSKYGMMAMSPRATDGTITPARAGCMWSRSSCRFRKYHGA